MPDILLKKVPKDLHYKIRMAAFELHLPMYKWILQVLAKAVEKSK